MRRQLRCFQTRTFSTRQNGDCVMLRYSEASLVLRGTDERFFAALRMTGWLGCIPRFAAGRKDPRSINHLDRTCPHLNPAAGVAPDAVPKLVP
jgi:hypothetical protein